MFKSIRRYVPLHNAQGITFNVLHHVHSIRYKVKGDACHTVRYPERHITAYTILLYHIRTVAQGYTVINKVYHILYLLK